MMRAMSVSAIAGYIEGLIARQKPTLSAAKVQDQAGVRQNYLWKLVKGEIKEPGASTIGQLVRAANGDMERAFDLLLDPNASYDDGYEAGLKEQVIQREQDIEGRIARLSPEQRQKLRQILGLLGD